MPPNASNCVAIDIGNSGLKVSYLNLADRSILHPSRIRWAASSELAGEASFDPGSPQWLDTLEQYLKSHQIECDCRWLVASVRRDALAVLTGFLNDRGCEYKVVSLDDIPLEVRVDEPQKVGIDRLLAAYAATKVTEDCELLVVQAGSAVTVDLVTGNGTSAVAFEGGAILPGVPMIVRLLGRSAELLPEIEARDLTELPTLPGKNTAEAMLCGAASSLVGGVRHLVERYEQRLGKPLTTILGGGDGTRLLPHLTKRTQVIDNLVERGLLELALQSCSSNS